MVVAVEADIDVSVEGLVVGKCGGGLQRTTPFTSTPGFEKPSAMQSTEMFTRSRKTKLFKLVNVSFSKLEMLLFHM